jgi:hypothetical protein
MPDRESQSDVNPGRVERGLDAAPTQGAENSENQGLRENHSGDRSDPVPGPSGSARPAPREDPASGGGLS